MRLLIAFCCYIPYPEVDWVRLDSIRNLPIISIMSLPIDLCSTNYPYMCLDKLV